MAWVNVSPSESNVKLLFVRGSDYDPYGVISRRISVSIVGPHRSIRN